jgi:phosphopantothenoylcysteine decarboxylase/phosphopantothenate--cysteine ligase
MSGSIASAKATGLISLWIKAGHNVKVVCTQSVFKFVGKATLEGLSNNIVISSVFEDDNMMEHIHLSRWADRIILAPATANVINKLVAGIADDIVTTTWVAALQLDKPMFIAPAMNSMMWNYPATKNSIKKLKQWKINILMPESGELACGETGSGRLMEINDINQAVFSKKQSSNLKKNILITAGGTREYIDGVRYIGNLSTGKTGADIADYFTNKGYAVTWLGAINAIQPQLVCDKVFYETFIDLSEHLKNLLSKNEFDAIIQAAAISDFSVASIKINNKDIIASRDTKLPTSEAMNLTLKKNPKLISSLKTWSQNKNVKVIAFKLTNTKDLQIQKTAIEKLLNQNCIDSVAHNDLSDIKKNTHTFTLYKDKSHKIHCESVIELCKNIEVLNLKLLRNTNNANKGAL